MTNDERPERPERPDRPDRPDRSPQTVDARPAEASPAPRPRDRVDEASENSFPASDPPSWSAMRAGPPRA